MADQDFPMSFPVKGLDVATDLELQPPGTTPLGVNVRAFEPATQRERGASRPGLRKYITDQLPGAGLIQSLDTVITTSAAALNPDESGSGGTQLLVDIPNVIPFTVNFRATQVQSGFGFSLTSGSNIFNPLPHPPIYPKDTTNSYVVYFTGSDNNAFPVEVNGDARLRVPFTGQLVSAPFPVTPTDYQAANYSLNGQVFQVENGVEVARPGMDFTIHGSTNWKVPYIVYLTDPALGNPEFGFKDNVTYALTSNGSSITSLCAIATSNGTVTCNGVAVNSGSQNTISTFDLIVYNPPSAPAALTSVPIPSTLDLTMATCTDGTNFFYAGAPYQGNLAAGCIGPTGSVIWQRSNILTLSDGINFGAGPEMALAVSGGVLYCHIPNVLQVTAGLFYQGVVQINAATGALLAQQPTNADIQTAGGTYRNNENVLSNNSMGLSLAAASGSIAIPLVSVDDPPSPFNPTSPVGLGLWDIAAKKVRQPIITNLGPAVGTPFVTTDGTDFYLLVTGLVGCTVYKIKGSSGSFLWSAGGFDTSAVICCIAGSAEVIVSMTGTTIHLDPATGLQTHSTSPLAGAEVRGITDGGSR